MIITILSGLITLCWSVYTAIQYEKIFPDDLRNRIVGARLQKDGKMPYFYKWRTGDGIRYYNPQNFNSLKVSTSTASPFFHQLLYPIANMDQRTITRLWVYLQYLLLLIITALALMLSVTATQKIMVLAAAMAFLHTKAWIIFIASGQLYLFIPCIAMLFYFFIHKGHGLIAAFLTGLFVISLVLIRPNTVFMFLPFLFLIRSYSLRYKAVFFVPVIILLAWIAGNSRQRALWIEYKQCLSEHIKFHQNTGPAFQQNEKDPEFDSWEGWNRREIQEARAGMQDAFRSEHGNVFSVVRKGLGIKLSPAFLIIASLSLIFVLVLLFYFMHRRFGFHVYNLAILGFCLYMISDLFSPIIRLQYYTVQWIFPLLLAAAGFEKKYKWIYVFLVLGLILNMINIPSVIIERTLGEYIIFAALLLLAFVYNRPQQLKTNFHSVH